MEYMTMLEKPGMVGSLVELIDDSEYTIVKRTIRVFTNVYRHSIILLAEGKLDPAKYTACYEDIREVSNKLIDMLSEADNEGVVVHLVRYLEAALVSHILSDLSNYPKIASMTAPMLDKGVTALLQFVELPHVGGISFCVAMRAIITVACHKTSMRNDVIKLVEKLLNQPPPNLFDHNVRSFYKSLQRNLFRLLRRAELDHEKEKLVDLMVRVGVPRRRLYEWMPKRPKRSLENDQQSAAKRLKQTEDDIIKFAHLNKVTKIIPTTKAANSNPSKAVSILDSILSVNDKTKSNISFLDFKGPLNPKLAAILFPKKKGSIASDDFFANLCSDNNSGKNSNDTLPNEIKFTDRCNLKEKMIYNQLSHDRVVDLLIESTLALPEERPDYIPTVYLDKQERMKEKLAILLSQYIPDSECFKYLKFDNLSKEKNREEEPQIKLEIVHEELREQPKEEKSGIKLKTEDDTDVIQSEQSKSTDVDMRLLNQPARDPRLTRKLQEEITTNSSPNVDPRLKKSSTKVVTNSDPRLKNRSPPIAIPESPMSPPVVNNMNVPPPNMFPSQMLHGNIYTAPPFIPNTVPSIPITQKNNIYSIPNSNQVMRPMPPFNNRVIPFSQSNLQFPAPNHESYNHVQNQQNSTRNNTLVQNMRDPRNKPNYQNKPRQNGDYSKQGANRAYMMTSENGNHFSNNNNRSYHHQRY